MARIFAGSVTQPGKFRQYDYCGTINSRVDLSGRQTIFSANSNMNGVVCLTEGRSLWCAW